MVSSVAFAADSPSPAPGAAPEKAPAAAPRGKPAVWNTTVLSPVDRLLILQESQRRKLAVPEVIVDEQIESIVTNQFDGHMAAFEEALRNEGSSMEAFHQLKRDDLVVAAMKADAAKDAQGREAKEQAVRDWITALRLKASIDIP
jgi:hypothetical protein